MSKKKAMFFKQVVSGGTTPSILDSTSTSSSNSRNIVLNKPIGVVSGDLLLIVVYNDVTTSTLQWNDTTNKPTGFTLANDGASDAIAGNNSSDVHTAVFWREADETETATVTVTSVDLPSATAGFYLRMTSDNASNPINKIGAKFALSNVASSVVAEVTTTVSNCLVLSVVGTDGSDVLPLSYSGAGWSEYITNSDTAGVGAVLAEKEQITAGLTGDLTVTGSATDGHVNFQIAIQ